MHIQIPHTGEGMVSHRTPSNPAIVRTFPIRVLSTIWLVLTPCLLYLKGFATKWANKPTWKEPQNQSHVGPCGVYAWFEH